MIVRGYFVVLKAGPLRLKQLTNTLKISVLYSYQKYLFDTLLFIPSYYGYLPVKTCANNRILLAEK